MKAEYDFSKGRRGQAVPTKGKTRITIYIDDQIVAALSNSYSLRCKSFGSPHMPTTHNSSVSPKVVQGNKLPIRV